MTGLSPLDSTVASGPSPVPWRRPAVNVSFCPLRFWWKVALHHYAGVTLRSPPIQPSAPQTGQPHTGLSFQSLQGWRCYPWNQERPWTPQGPEVCPAEAMPRGGVNRGTRTELGSVEDDSYTVRMTPFKRNSPKLQTQ